MDAKIKALIDYKYTRISIGKLGEILGLDIYDTRFIVKLLDIHQVDETELYRRFNEMVNDLHKKGVKQGSFIEVRL